MKKIFFILIMGAYTMINAQVQIPNLEFVFDREADFTEQFADEAHSNVFDLSINGLTNAKDKALLLETVREMRGVEAFSIEKTAQGYKAQLKVYKYANGWWYWSMFMRMVGIPTIKIEGNKYTTDNIEVNH